MPIIPLHYFGYHPYNHPTHSERNVELPLAFWFLKKFAGELSSVVEVGEVTPFYEKPRHTVYDPVAELPGTLAADAQDLDYAGKNLLSISTIEHIGTADYGQTPDPERLPRVLRKMLASRNYLITFALGYNRQLEELVQGERYLVLERLAPTRWRQSPKRELGGYQYSSPHYAGNGLCVLTNMDDLHFEFTRRSVWPIAARWPVPQWSWRHFLRDTRQEIRDERASRKSA